MRSVPALALAASLAIVGPGLAPAASAAGHHEGTVAYLAEQLEADGDRIQVTSEGQTFDDLGLTIDTVLAMTASGSGGDASEAATDHVLANADSYDGTGAEVYAGATAKLLTFASARGLDPHDLAGTDLVAQLQHLEQPDGQFTDDSEHGDYSNTLGQSLGLISLERAGADPSTGAVDFLLAQQCDDGGFSLKYTTGCESDPDATALAVQALSAVGGHGSEMARAVDHLVAKQGDEGGVGGGTTTKGSNSNSTALAAVAFALADEEEAHAAAFGYLESLIFGCATPALTGALAYDKTSFEAATAQGRDAEPTDQIIRATAPGLLALSGESYVSVSADGQESDVTSTDCSEDTAASAAATETSRTSTEEGVTVSQVVVGGLIVAGVALIAGVVLMRRRGRNS